uniref:Uncharacterized protein n=2 Tax=Human herpesvirus 2 TaxID=10310 RepID=A0A481TS11_HHV2|nr:hypothetical protein [Human alphaherpesvirus 2]QBH82965.1 hypothetical protein [Human alphaherpesvirus 2]
MVTAEQGLPGWPVCVASWGPLQTAVTLASSSCVTHDTSPPKNRMTSWGNTCVWTMARRHSENRSSRAPARVPP